MEIRGLVEVGSFIWWLGCAILAFLALFLFLLAPRKGNPIFDRWLSALGWIIFLNMVWNYVMLLSEGRFTVAESLPLHMCGFSELLLFAYLTCKQDWAFPIVVFWGPLGSIQAILTPALNILTPGHILQFYLAHSAAVVVPIYLMVHGGRRIPRNAFWCIFVITNAVGLAMIGINAVLGSNYWFVNRYPPVDPFYHRLIRLEWPYYLMEFEVVLIISLFLFRLIFGKFMEPGTQ